MFELPTSWASVLLNDVAEPRAERISPSAMPTAQYIGMEHVEAHSNKILATVPASTMASNAVSFAAGNVLYGRMRPYLNKVVRPKFDGLASAEFIVFPESPALDPDFLLMRLSAQDFVRFACSQYEGDRPRVKFDQLGKFDLRLPPRAEQTRIVAKLEELLSDLDAGVAELKAAQQKLARYRQSLLKAAVTGELTTKWRAASDLPASAGAENGHQLLQRILTERRARWEARQLAKFEQQGKAPPSGWQKKYPEPVPPDTSGLPELPQGWVWASVDALCDSVRNGLSKTPNTEQRGFPIFKINAVRPMALNFEAIKHIEISEGEVVDYWVETGDVLATRYNGSIDLLGVFALVRNVPQKTLHPDKLIRMKPVTGVGLGAWMEVCGNVGASREHLVSRVKTTAGQTGISGDDLKKTPIPLPPADEQLAAIELLDERLDEIEKLSRATELALQQSTAQRQNLLRAAFAGQLVPQDPADEPASALLDRIRAERAQREAVKKPRGHQPKRAI